MILPFPAGYSQNAVLPNGKKLLFSNIRPERAKYLEILTERIYHGESVSKVSVINIVLCIIYCRVMSPVIFLGQFQTHVLYTIPKWEQSEAADRRDAND